MRRFPIVLVGAAGLIAALLWTMAPTPASAATTKFSGFATGTNENPSNASNPGGGFTITIDDATNQICLNAVGLSLNGTRTADHIHSGAAGVNGPIVVDFANSLNTCVTDTDAAAILANPSAYYFNVHTTTFPGGAARAQLGTPNLHRLYASSNGANEKPAAATNLGTALVKITLDTVSGETCVDGSAVKVGGTEAITADHIHTGDASVAGPVLINFNGLRVTCVIATPTQVNNILANPAGFYVNFHTTAFPGGASRGQLQTSPGSLTAVPLSATMSSANEVPSNGSGAGGPAIVTVDPADNTVCVNETAVTGLTGPVTGSHIHNAAAGVNGPIVVQFNGLRDTCVVSDSATVNGILANPANYYLNLHTAANPGGETRGQLGSAFHLTADVNGANEVPPNANTGQGKVEFILDSINNRVCIDASRITGLDPIFFDHIHQGAAGVTGPVVVDFSSQFLTCATTTNAQIVAILADPTGFYVNFHTGAFPGGASRSQLSLVGTLPTTTTLGADHSASVYSEPVTFTATVAATPPASGTPTGNVEFREGATVLATVPLAGGVANWSTSTLEVGAHDVTAVYLGNLPYGGSTSAPFTDTVSLASTNLTLGSSLNPSNPGESVTFTATLTSVAPATVSPGGVNVQFLDGATVLDTRGVSGGVATFTTSTLSAGTHTISAKFLGNSRFAATQSPNVVQTVNKPNTTTTIGQDSTDTVFKQSVTFTVNVDAVPPATGHPASTVQIKDGASVLAVVPLVNGVATYTTTALSAGSHSISAAFLGGSNYNASSSAPVTHNVAKADTTTNLTSNANPQAAGSPVTFTATVSAVAPGTGAPASSVQFFDGATLLATRSMSGGVATFTTSSLGVGPHTITAVCLGGVNYNGSTSSPLVQSIT